MKYTNHHDLPAPLCRAVKERDKMYSRGESNISTTSLIDSPLIFWLREHRGEKLVQDVSEILFSTYGSIMHGILELSATNLEGALTEVRAFTEVKGWVLSGQVDYVEIGDDTLYDYKFTSAWSIASATREGLKPEHVAQLNVNRYILAHAKDPELHKFGAVTKLAICMIGRDWGPRHKRDGTPRAKIFNAPVWSDEKCLAYIEERTALHQEAMADSANPPPVCTDEERWASEPEFAVVKQGRKSALRVLHSWEEANSWINANTSDKEQDKISIEERPLLYKRCEDYCEFRKGLCPYWRG